MKDNKSLKSGWSGLDWYIKLIIIIIIVIIAFFLIRYLKVKWIKWQAEQLLSQSVATTTVGGVTVSTLKKYIENQQQPED